MSTAAAAAAPTRPDDDACYRALVAHDPRFDGAFFVGVASTGIYCRTVCPAKTPRRENCAFYASAAAAEKAGYRPCLRCRPELAPGGPAPVDAVGRLAALAASRIEDGALADGGVEGLAAELGVSDRHLRRVVERELGVTPVELAQTQRLLLAKRLLTDTDLSVTAVALASGFSSLRRFHALFRERYKLNPTGLRRSRAAGRLPDSLACDLAYRPPLDWDALLAFLAGRAVAGVEAVEDGRYLRAVRWGGATGWIAVSHAPGGRPALRVEVSASLAAHLPAVLARVKRQFDLAADPEAIAAHLGDIVTNPGLRVVGSFDPFETAVRAILGQQVSVKSATTLACRFAAAFGEPAETPSPAVNLLPPTPERVAALEPEDLIRLGIITARARSILALARAVADGTLILDPGRGDVGETMRRLKELPGVGEWTAQIVALRALGWPDAFPHTDLGVLKALGETDPKRVLERAEAWRPWRAYATMHLWGCGATALRLLNNPKEATL